MLCILEKPRDATHRSSVTGKLACISHARYDILVNWESLRWLSFVIGVLKDVIFGIGPGRLRYR